MAKRWRLKGVPPILVGVFLRLYALTPLRLSSAFTPLRLYAFTPYNIPPISPLIPYLTKVAYRPKSTRI